MRVKTLSLMGSTVAVAVVATAIATQPSTAAVEAPANYSLLSPVNPAKSTDLTETLRGDRELLVSYGGRPEFSKRVVSDRVRDIYVVPAADNPCLVVSFKAGGGNIVGCSHKGQPVVDVSIHGSTGVVPDNVRSVEAVLDDGTKQTVPVISNVFNPPVNASVVSYEDRGRTVRVELMPLSSLPAGSEVSEDGALITLGPGDGK